MARRSADERKLDELLADCYADPLRHVMVSYPWASDPTIQLVPLAPQYRKRFDSEFGPGVWACEFLDRLGRDIKARGFDGKHAVEPIQYAVASGHGIGKSVMVAWLIKFIMDTRPFCRGTVTANTADQLRSKTWAELGKWHAKSLTAPRFEYRTGRGSMSLFHREAPNTWFVNAVTCREENSEAFAGQHAANSTSFYIFDEASGIPGIIYKVRAGGLTDGEPMTFDFGNPTRNSGDFFEECEGNQSHRVYHINIDSRDVEITNKEYNQRLIDDYGEDSDFVRVRVKGQFPSRGSTQFIPAEDVVAAMDRELALKPLDNASRYGALVIGVDPARFGDDESVIKARIGDDARSWPAKRYKGLDTVQLVGRVIETVHEFAAIGLPVAGLFVDGVGLGAGVVDQLRHLGYNPIEVQSAGSATDKKTYRRKGDEMWAAMRDHLKTRLCLPRLGSREAKDADQGVSNEAADLRTQLISREMGFTKSGQIQLESKDDMKKRGLSSPDVADALALTYAQEVAANLPNGLSMYMAAPLMTRHEYDPLEMA